MRSGLFTIVFSLAALTQQLQGQLPNSLDEGIPALMANAEVPGLSAAWIQDGKVAWTGAFGVANGSTGAPVSDETVFEAASLSKPVVAYLTLRLVAQGTLDLDVPLWDPNGYDRLAHDDRARRITARMVLSHTAGLPNWGGTPLELNQDPGVSWNYSGEGFVYLAEILERRTGFSLDELAHREVFGPLGMTHSSFVWRSDYDRTGAAPHDLIGRVSEKHRPTTPNAAASLHTTARDYARFVLAVMNGEGLPTALAADMLDAQSSIGGWGDQATWDYLSWGLGWGLQRGDRAPAIWHWGDNGNFRCFVVAYPSDGEGFVYFTNSNNGLSIAESMVDLVFEDTHWALKYLDYQTWDQPRRRARIGLQRAFIDGDATDARALLQTVSEEFPNDVAENEVGRLATLLLDEGEEALGISVLEWAAERFASASSHRALGEAYTQKGEYRLGASSYEEAIRLDPSFAENLRTRIRWLQEGIDAQEVDYRPEAVVLAEYEGSYGPRTITLLAGSLNYAREGATSNTRLVPMMPDLYALEGNPTFRLRFDRDSAGRVIGVVGLYADGRTDRSERSR